MRHYFKQQGLLIAWLIALFGCCMSIFCREILNFEPCPLCWYQRMALFPLALILGMALFRGDYKIGVYCLPFALFGFLVAIYQVFGMYFPFILHTGLCGSGTQCSTTMFTLFGVITMPMLSGLGFAIITACLLLSRKS